MYPSTDEKPEAVHLPLQVYPADAPGIEIEMMGGGDLKFTANAEGVQWLRDNRGDKSDLDVLFDLLETSSCNGGFKAFDAGQGNPNVGLTCAPCIAESMRIKEDGSQVIEGRFWYFEQYMIADMVDRLIRDGELVFTKGPDNEPEADVRTTRKPRP